MKMKVGNFQTLIRFPIAAFKEALIRRSISTCLPENLIKFLIISAPRSGSNLLCGILNSHPQILCFHELFHKKSIFYGPKNNNKYNFGTLAERDEDQKRFISKIYSLEHGYKAVGFKMFNGHNNILLSALVKNKNIKKIILYRNAVLNAFVSLEIARKTNKYQSTRKIDLLSAETTKIVLNIESFKKYVDKKRMFFEWIKKRIDDQPFFELDYTDIVKKTSRYKKLLPFIGVENLPSLKPIHQKQNPVKLSEKIYNFDEVCLALKNTKYAKYLKKEL
jgi:hypothetical protein